MPTIKLSETEKAVLQLSDDQIYHGVLLATLIRAHPDSRALHAALEAVSTELSTGDEEAATDNAATETASPGEAVKTAIARARALVAKHHPTTDS